MPELIYYQRRYQIRDARSVSKNTQWLLESCRKMPENKQTVLRTLRAMRSFPDIGEECYRLLYVLYVNGAKKPSVAAVMEYLDYWDIRTYYAHKHEALALFDFVMAQLRLKSPPPLK